MNRENAKYPEVLKNPTIADVFKNFHTREWITTLTLSAASGVFGFAIGEPYRKPPAIIATWIGFSGGIALAYQHSAARLRGFSYNRKECRKYGVRYYKRELRVKETQPHEEIEPSLKDSKAEL